MQTDRIEDLIEDIRLGKMVVLVDDEDRENEGDLVMAAQCVEPVHINFMAKYGRGLICMPASMRHCAQLGLKPMVQGNKSGFGTKFTTSIEASHGVTTGISAADRAHTIRVASSPDAKETDIVQPGHIFPLMAEEGGVLVRAGHTEASCDLSRMAGFAEVAGIWEIMNDDGTMARRPELEEFARQHGLKLGTIADLIQYRLTNESTVLHLEAIPVSNDYGDFVLHTYQDVINDDIHFALVRGQIADNEVNLVRVQLALTARDLLGVQIDSQSGWNVQRCMARIAQEGSGVLVLLGGGETKEVLLDSLHGLKNRSPGLRSGKSGLHNSFLNIGVGSQILRHLGVRKLKHMSSPIKYNAISGFDLEIVEYVSFDGQ